VTDTIEKLREGHSRFRKEVFAPNESLFGSLALEQKPNALVIACADSRVDPAMITGAAPGELFVVRNVANLVPPFQTSARTHHGTSAALEYAVTVLEVGHIIVMGHAHCGGIHALMTGAPGVGVGNDFVKKWMEIAAPARERTLAALPEHRVLEQARRCERESLRSSLDNLMTFPCIEHYLADGKLALHAWYFDIAEGSLQRYDPETDALTPL
jgi:carbonic anhydrase